MQKKRLYAVFMLFAVAVLSACGSPEAPKETLEERVLARWHHMIERDFEAAWEYYAPGFRQTTPVDAFVRDMERRPIRWREVELVSSECEEDRCDIRVRVVYQAVGAPSGLSSMQVPRLLSERWIAVDQGWWYSGS